MSPVELQCSACGVVTRANPGFIGHGCYRCEEGSMWEAAELAQADFISLIRLEAAAAVVASSAQRWPALGHEAICCTRGNRGDLVGWHGSYATAGTVPADIPF